ncbi:hypothetical protein XELAEV_18032613mg [Xenopus laevis]|uniref:Ig-like domain-containing protein n=1 Tax=Xenopus laevis TaxID=8355 RepID=A0A974CJ62_XENLA|nr:hypothetical protein XELAEV_18032613mg [Xenopus laevis]
MWPLRVALLFHLSLSFLHFSLSDSVSSAVLGSSAELICQFTPVVDAKNVEIRWFTRSFRPYVHQYKNGEDNYREQMEEFRGRTEFLKQDITQGVGTLIISNVTLGDEGRYSCFYEFDNRQGEVHVELKVAAMGLNPLISIEDYQQGEITLKCESSGWYPAPVATWLDESGNNMKSSVEINNNENTGLFHVKTALLIASDSKVSCHVRNDLLGTGKESSVQFASSFYWRVDRSGISRFIMMAASVVVMVIVIVVTPIITIRFQRIKKLQSELGSLKSQVAKFWERVDGAWCKVDTRLGQVGEDRNRINIMKNCLCSNKVSVTLNRETAPAELQVEEGGKSVLRPTPLDPKPENMKEGFDTCVIGAERFTTGKHCWEVQIKDRFCSIGVTQGPQQSVVAMQLYDLSHKIQLGLERDQTYRLYVLLDYEEGSVTVFRADTLMYITEKKQFTGDVYPFFEVLSDQPITM